MSESRLDEDTRRKVASGRATLGAMLSTLQTHLQKIFVLFVLGLLGTIYGMRNWGWQALKGVTEARMDAATASQFEVLVRTPFDVILLQVKLGLLAGLLLSLPLVAYFTRATLQERGQWPLQLSRVKTALIGATSVVLFAGGISYAYFVFFPVAFDFLTTYTLNVGFEPTYDLVKWTHFILLLTLSFGLAAQLPLAMSGLSYAGIVPYEYFREKWRHAAVLIFVFGAFFSPPDPFTQIMWAVPLLALYAASLYLTKFVTAVKRGGSAMVRAKLRRNWYKVATPFAAVAGVTFAFLWFGGLGWAEANLLPAVPAEYRPGSLSTAAFPLAGTAEWAVAALSVAAVVTFPVLVYYAWPELQPRGSTGAPAAIDVGELDAAGVQAAPRQAFETMSEDDAVAIASDALDAGNDAKAQAVLDRFDAVQEEREGAPEESGSVGEVATETTAGMVGAFTDDDTSEEEIGGYAYDLAFVLESLTSKSFRVVAVFLATVLGTFFALYGGAFEFIKSDFLSRLPDSVPVEEVAIVALHPVEALLFEVKMSLLVGIVAAMPAVLYYVWPAVEERFYGISHSYDTPAPGTAVAANWNKVAAFAVLGAVGVYAAVTEYAASLPVALPADPVTLAGTTLTPETVLYLVAATGGLVLAAPVAGYYARPSLHERWVGESKRGAFVLWFGTLVGGVSVGVLVGYLYVAPGIISYLVYDAQEAGMVINYTINNFFWLVFFTTAGIGLLAEVPLTMWLFHYTGIVSYRTMHQAWRAVVMVVFIAAAVFTDHSVVTMFLFGIPITLMYWTGLAGLWASTLPGRLLGRSGAEAG